MIPTKNFFSYYNIHCLTCLYNMKAFLTEVYNVCYHHSEHPNLQTFDTRTELTPKILPTKMCYYTFLRYSCGHKASPRWEPCTNAAKLESRLCPGGFASSDDPTGLLWSYEFSKRGLPRYITEHEKPSKEQCGECSYAKMEREREARAKKMEILAEQRAELYRKKSKILSRVNSRIEARKKKSEDETPEQRVDLYQRVSEVLSRLSSLTENGRKKTEEDGAK